MPKTRVQKQVILNGLEERLGRAKSVVFTAFNGLTVKKSEEIRRSLKEKGSEYVVAKKTLMDLAMKNSGYPAIETREMDGQMAAIFGFEDEVSPAKVVDDFLSDKENTGKVVFLGGVLEGRFIDKDQVIALAQIPSREVLYAKLVGSMNAPVSGFVNALAGNLRNLVGVLKSIEEKKA